MSTEHQERLQREQAFHDARWADDHRSPTVKYYEVDAGRIAYAAALDEVAAGDEVVEFGVGGEASAIGLAERGVSVTGIDISPVAVEHATEDAERRGLADTLRFSVMDAHALDVGDATLDVVCGASVLHHLDLDLAFPEIARVLRPDGWAVFYEPLGTNPAIRLYRRLTPKMRTVDEHPFLPRDFDLARRSFAAVDVRHFTFLALGAVVLRRLPGGTRAVRALHRVDAWLFRRLPPSRWLAWTVVITLAEPRRD